MPHTDKEIIQKADTIKSRFITNEALSKKSLHVPVKMDINHFYTVIYEIKKEKGLSPVLTNARVVRQ